MTMESEVKTSEVEVTNVVDTTSEDQAKQAIREAAQKRRQDCANEVGQILKKFNCDLQGVLMIRGTNAEHTIDVVANV